MGKVRKIKRRKCVIDYIDIDIVKLLPCKKGKRENVVVYCRLIYY